MNKTENLAIPQNNSEKKATVLNNNEKYFFMIKFDTFFLNHKEAR